MMRRFVALCLSTCLLVVACIAAAPAAPTLVCRMTGRSMAPVVATSTTRRSCCAVAAAETADGIRFSLTRPGCCDLHFSPRGDMPSASAPTTPDHPLTAVWAPAPSFEYMAATSPITAQYLLVSQDAPRGPPPRSASPRAPPLFA